MQMIILAAGQGTRLRPITDTRPKCLVEVAGKTLLDWQLETARLAGVDRIALVAGYRADMINQPGVTYLTNPRYDTTNMVETLMCADSLFGEGFIISYGDIVYEERVLRALLDDTHDIAVVVDRGWQAYWQRRFDDALSDAETLQLGEKGRIIGIGQKPSSLSEIQGQYIGLLAFRGEGVDAVRAVYAHARAEAEEGRNPLRGQRPLEKMYMTDLVQGLIDLGHTVFEVPVNRGWLEIDSLSDLEVAEKAIDRDSPHLRVTE